MRRLPVALLLAVALAGAAPAAAAAAKTLRVVVRGQDHRPFVGKRWHYEVRVTDAATGKPVACRIHLQFLFGSLPVGEVGVHVVKTGVWQETFGTPGHPPFPPAARGQHLTLQATATATAKGYATGHGSWTIVPR
ncbi:MAG TPA: hypothetical protein VGN27_14200 [Gaiellaceae bacterium]|nr:hypothetical protein [Gaiellaceae bacterium]